MNQYLSNAAFALQLAAFAMLFGGDAICTAMKVPKPEFLSAMQENRMMAGMGIWLVGNMLSAQLLNTGAFEIQHGDKLVWSSLETKRLPTMVDLKRAFEQTGVEFIQLRDPDA
ncbi:unnamed protein product [Cladocopium goreaui]|uniref:Thioredoxin reductase-like selenoprotein T homolog CG3887 n=1 Tax=Cladocopium goreaui TaxID=2562237 RepID=A0A9P1CG20_9DINO|nr:unnamed protein product [Cladocopium goreaui]|mmetsp:Transcript_31816/g.68522  ORF Transcript_31816/g.68522 Transcript_31816/m.68522 type:complete len:113 (-) Transcript_31816:309-647(-)